LSELLKNKKGPFYETPCTLGKKAIFHWFCFPQVVHKQTLGEVENWTFI